MAVKIKESTETKEARDCRDFEHIGKAAGMKKFDDVCMIGCLTDSQKVGCRAVDELISAGKWQDVASIAAMGDRDVGMYALHKAGDSKKWFVIGKAAKECIDDRGHCAQKKLDEATMDDLIDACNANDRMSIAAFAEFGHEEVAARAEAELAKMKGRR